jgi:uncharacterized membrane protein YraQ (UPF0718 family)
MRIVGLVAGFLLLAVASVLAWRPYVDRFAGGGGLVVIGALVAAAATVLVARSGLRRIDRGGVWFGAPREAVP